MNTFILLILILIFGFISFHFINQKLQDKFLYFTGLEYLFLGILIGAPFLNWINSSFALDFPILLSPESSLQLKPVIALIIGTVGFTTGLKLRFKDYSDLNRERLRLALTDVIFTTLILFFIFFGIFRYFFAELLTFNEALANALVIGTTASTYSYSVLQILKNKFHIEGPNYKSLLFSSSISNIISIILFGMLFSIVHQGVPKNLDITITEWFVINIVIGIVIGILFFIFLEREENENKLFLALMGIIIFTSGVAYYLNFSTLFISLIMGIFIANTSKVFKRIEATLEKLEHPFYVIILIYAGSILSVTDWFIWGAGLGLYLILRMNVKNFNGWFAYQASYDKTAFSPTIGKGLNSQGMIAIAMALNFIQVYENVFSITIFSVIITAVIVNEFLSIKWTRDVLIDLNEISPMGKKS
jgi:Kef-type K+ transport system membrane component KefB